MSEIEQVKERRNEVVSSIFVDQLELLQAAMSGAKNITPDKLRSTFLQVAMRLPDIWKCSKQSILDTVLLAARLDIDPSGHHNGAHFVPFFNKDKKIHELKIMLGYNAMIDLATRDGRVLSFTVGAIYADEEHRITLGTRPEIHHVPGTKARTSNDRPVRVYAIAWFPGGHFEAETMSLAEVEAIRAKSQQKDGPPWKYAFPEMAKKTVLRRLIKRLPLTPSAAVAIEQADEVDGFEFNGSRRRPVTNEADDLVNQVLPGRVAQDEGPTDADLANQPEFDPDELKIPF